MSSQVAPTTDADEADLLSRLRAGDDAAFSDFVHAQAGRALTVCRRILGHDADAAEALQDAFLSFFRALPTFRGGSKLSTWLHQIAVNAALMKRRSRTRRVERTMDDLLPTFYPDGHRMDPRPAWQPSAADLCQREDVRRKVRKRIDELPENYRNVLLLRDIEELDTAQAATILGETPGAVKTRLHRARQALRTLLEKDLLD